MVSLRLSQHGDDALGDSDLTKEVRERVEELERAKIDAWPRLSSQDTPSTSAATVTQWKDQDQIMIPEHEDIDFDMITGRIQSMRFSGKKLVFVDLQTEQDKVQVMLNYAALQDPRPTEAEFQDYCRVLRRGDHVLVETKPSKTRDGDPSLQALAMPVLQSPCLQRFPVFDNSDVSDADSDTPVDRHGAMLTSSTLLNVLKYRSNLVQSLREFLLNMDFVEVQTPILAAQAGGAAARSFETSATEFSDRKLSLRIAPELWLKRLVIGGMHRVFEIGPSFRNEGLDKTHNPEFTTCEFYAAHWTLAKLKYVTERMLRSIEQEVEGALDRHSTSSDKSESADEEDDTEAEIPQESIFGKNEPKPFFRFKKPHQKSFDTVDFIPALNSVLGIDLPNLASHTAQEQVLDIFRSREIPLPATPTLPRLLDTLSSQFLEPHCHGPTWIENIPECMSPLSKSFIHPTALNNQPVAARAELFVKGKELVNCYEEENNPFEQRRKFMEQQQYNRDPASGKIDEEAMKIDEDYIRGLEWGLPPTGGFGMGIDRLVMLMTGSEKISDVLAFGNLRHVTRGAEKWEKRDEKK